MATKQLNADALFVPAEEAGPYGHSNLAHLFLQETGKTNKLNSHRTYNWRASHLFAHVAPLSQKRKPAAAWYLFVFY